MAHRERLMFETPGGWLIRCRVCPKRLTQHPLFDTQRECHDWWRGHADSDLHKRMTSPDARAKRQAESALLRSIEPWPR